MDVGAHSSHFVLRIFKTRMTRFVYEAGVFNSADISERKACYQKKTETAFHDVGRRGKISSCLERGHHDTEVSVSSNSVYTRIVLVLLHITLLTLSYQTK